MSKVSIQTVISHYLLTYRNMPRSTTNKSPAELMFGRSLRTRLSLVKPQQKESDQVRFYCGKRDISFDIGEEVYVRDYRSPNKKQWQKAVIDEILGNRNYIVRLVDENIVWKRHLDQIIKAGDFYSQNREFPPMNEPPNVSEEASTDSTNLQVTESRPKRQCRLPSRLNL